jgi:hypothetical protein
MTKTKNATTPERVQNQIEEDTDNPIEVREYDPKEIEETIGEMAIDTRGAITKVKIHEGPKPMPQDKRIKELTSKELDERAEARLKEILPEMDKGLQTQIDRKLAEVISASFNMNGAIDRLLSHDDYINNPFIRLDLDQYGIGKTSPTESDSSDLPHQIEGHARRSKFIRTIEDHAKGVIQKHLDKRLTKYKDLIGNKSTKIGLERTREGRNVALFYFKNKEED